MTMTMTVIMIMTMIMSLILIWLSFPISKHYLHHEMERGSKKAGVKKIRIHDLRHSSCALLIHLGYSPVQIAERLGHESAVITQRYSHLYPSVQKEMANRLDDEFNGEDD